MIRFIPLLLVFATSLSAQSISIDSLKTLKIGELSLLTKSGRLDSSILNDDQYFHNYIEATTPHLYKAKFTEIEELLDYIKDKEIDDSLKLSKLNMAYANLNYIQDRGIEAANFFSNARNIYPRSDSLFETRATRYTIFEAKSLNKAQKISEGIQVLDSVYNHISKEVCDENQRLLLDEIARLFYKQGSFEEAIGLLEKSLSCKGLVKEDTLTITSDIISSLFSLERHEEVLQRSKFVLGNSPKRVMTKLNILKYLVYSAVDLGSPNICDPYIYDMKLFVKSLNKKKYSDILDRTLGIYYAGKRDYISASNYLRKSEAYNSSKSNKINNYKFAWKYRISSDISKYNEALSNDYTKFIGFSDSLWQLKFDNSINELSVKYETAEKQLRNQKLQQQNHLQQAELKTKNAYLIGGGVGLGLISLLAFLGWQQNQTRKQHNEELQTKNRKIALLNNEILHRSKNQLNLATSLIENQKYNAEDAGARALIEESEYKLRALAMVNSKLSNDMTGVDLAEVAKDIIEANAFSLSGNEKLELDVNTQGIQIDAEKLSTIALIINELSVNSIKYAFLENDEPSIKLHASKENGHISIAYTDNGVGKDTGVVAGTGTKLIQGLVLQLNATYSEKSDGGYTFTLKMPNQYE